MADDFSPLKKAMLASSTSKLHLGVVGAGVGAALLASGLDFGGQLLPALTLGLGLLAYAALVALDLTNPDFIRRANSRVRVEDEEARARLDPKQLRDAEVREVYQAILAGTEKCRALHSATNASLRDNLADGLRRSEDLAVVAGRAAVRSNAIRRHLDAESPDSLEKELQRLRALADRTKDAAARASFLQAADSKVKELETYHQLQGLRDRIYAQLKVIEASLDALAAKLVKLEASDVAEAISINDSITENVQTMTTDVQILESSYDETMQELRL
jgi:hypothetical protein